ncbi:MULTISPECIES: glycosyltransferase family 2 protein [Chromobacterium]|uniref:Glycosyltransferase family 2 protein n=1 Tax=Chromobacterium rhizoryzae TaxID=1778675 RepID=A0AAD0RWK4_9NEIS|nr:MULTISPECIES: glycosyltransferase family 2 protein [Chromobacterium]AXT48975.1 glycosyltransferase family 2 protein [Chromobacterium rhizoryzae]PTU72296.1 glycosyl transferase family 2 [Chromobacterium haemolyticum]QOD82923.1 glycosyltransferase family 2 protein [Chromobacterium haemolyticum]
MPRSGPVNDTNIADLKVAILLGTFNGQPHLSDQLDSFVTQTLNNWSVWASDDGSTDQTMDILEKYQSTWGKSRLTIRRGPQQGFAANFLSLVCDPNIDADYYAFSDQDDIWEADKLSAALTRLEQIPKETPALYCGRTLLVDENNNKIGFSKTLCKPPCFSNALLQNIAGGNTMVFNKAARDIMLATGKNLKIVSHDWWAYLLVSGCGGVVLYDPTPYIRYRQHARNFVGTNKGVSASLTRLHKIFHGRYREWLNTNLAALASIKDRLTLENKSTLESFSLARKKPLIIRTFAIFSSGVHRQTIFGNSGVFVASLLNKI